LAFFVSVTKELCLKTASLLERSADALVQLHKRIATEVGPGKGGEMLQLLTAAAAQTQAKLHAVCPPVSAAVSAGPSVEGGQAAPMQGDMVLIMQQYSDMLVSMVQQQISSNPA